MRAVVATRFGGPEVLEEREVERPAAGPGELLVRVVAASANPIDAKFRAAGESMGLEAPVVLGADVSGVVEEVGAGVEEFSPGDEVYYTPEIFGPGANGAYAEYHVVDADIAAPKPPSLSHEEAAAVPLAGGTAYEALVRRLAVGVGETVLIHGGAGGVGSFAVQIARACGARVIATAGPENQKTLEELGADVALDYTRDDVTGAVLEDTGGAGADAVFDTVGGETVARSIEATAPFGRMATILGAQGDLTAMYMKNQALYGVLLTRERERLEEMTILIERGQMRPLVDEVLDLGEVARAHQRLDSGHGRGKIVLRVARQA
ncbi:NADPH:quinone oxidoreductase [Rubrobacter xylanophilus]|uniref:NADPH:quinone oxidoreductase n=1 Tax=Rubrobacter xylanophilus TaxID=49319 RepID=A0A510HMG0_9ACTN|nr:zinc-dependent alcohol dehydrogenase family protein [Rubrobacter xylanophilus]BBL81181.1 NADPH:quinone oxidoreductase [Rubrobacter xylanophilus]